MNEHSTLDTDDTVRAAFDRLRADTAVISSDAAYQRVAGGPNTGWFGPRLLVGAALVLVTVIGLIHVLDRNSGPGTIVGEGDVAGDGDPGGPGLIGTSWELQSGAGPDGDVPLVDGWPVTLTFLAEADPGLGGSAACNDYGAPYRLDGNQITIEEIGQDAALCEPEVMASEAAYLAALRDVTTVAVDGDELTLTGPASRLVFGRLAPAPTEAVVGTTWLLESLIQGENVIPASGPSATLRLDPDGTLTGSTGCRTLDGEYVTTGNEIVFTSFGARGDCTPDLTDQDNIVVTVLGDGFVPEVDGDTLTLTSAGLEGLVYRAVEPDAVPDGDQAADFAEILDGTTWVLPENPLAVFDHRSRTLTFAGDGTVTGSDGCNTFTGVVSFDGPRLNIGSIEGEQEGCGDNQRYLDALQDVTELGIEGDLEQLILTGDDVELMFIMPLTVTELLEERPGGRQYVTGRLTPSSDAWILCEGETGDSIACLGRWVTLFGDPADDAGEVTFAGELDPQGRLVLHTLVGADPAAETSADLAAVEALRDGDLSDEALDWHPDGVTLSLGGTAATAVRTPAELAEPANWRIDLDEFRGRVGPFSALDALGSATEIDAFVGAHDHCASPPAPQPDVEYARQIVIVPRGIDSCLDWFAVDVLLDDAGRIVAVNFDTWEP